MPIPPDEYQALVNQTVIFTVAAMAAVAVALWRGCFAKGVLADAPLHRPMLRLPDIVIIFILLQLSMLLVVIVTLGGIDQHAEPIAYARGILIAQVLGYMTPMAYLFLRICLPGIVNADRSISPANDADEINEADGTVDSSAASDVNSGTDDAAVNAAHVTKIDLQQTTRLGRFGLGAFNLRHLKSAITALLLALPAVMAASSLAIFVRVLQGHAPPESGHDLLTLLNKTDQTGLMLALLCGSAVIVAPIGEEIVYRGVMQTALVRAMGKHMRPAVLLISSTLFALVHLGSVPGEMLPALFILGLILGWLYETTGSLWPGILLHALFNAINIALAAVEVLHQAPPS